MQRLGFLSPDALSDTLDTLRFQTAIFCRSELRAPWGFSVPARDFASFHLVTRGSACLDVDGEDRIWLTDGDLVILPRGHAHTMRDSPDSPSQRLEQLIAGADSCVNGKLSNRGHGPPTTLLCGGFQADGLGANALISALPTVIRLGRREYAHDMWTRLALEMLAQEGESTRAGADAVVKRLADMLFVEAIRSHVANADAASQVAVGLRDMRIGAALRAVHRHPADDWDLDLLAREAAMSRTSFALRFREIMGTSPGSYLTNLRMRRAADMLRSTRLSLPEVADRCGYASNAAFGRTFKRWFGESPAAYRARHDGTVSVPPLAAAFSVSPAPA